MQKIHKLSKHMANLIAAGEVVERPASVVKELIENSIDAGASVVTVEITGGGIASISVTDNGSGIPRDDVETAFLRHATSKLRTEEDLSKIETMGFRGEALAAIAAVSHVTMLTKTADAPVGTRIVLDGGAVADLADAGCPNGTKITVADLFFNTPARHKFLKKDSTEAAYVQTVCQRAAMAHPDLSVKLIKDGAVELHTPGDGSLYTVLYCLYGRDTALALTEVNDSREPVSVQGYVSQPTLTRASRTMQFFFVNGRPVKNGTIQAALEEAFRGKIVAGKFPCAFLNVMLPADMVDVNVHPAKTEVKFSAEKRVFEAVYYGVKAALEPAPAAVKPAPEPTLEPPRPLAPATEQTSLPVTGDGTGEVHFVYKKHMNSTFAHDIMNDKETERRGGKTLLRDSFANEETAIPSEPPAQSVTESLPPTEREPLTKLPERSGTFFPSPVPPPSMPQSAPNAVEQPTEQPDGDKPEDYRLVGELFGVYILAETADKLLMIDKHAAHERIRFNELLRHTDAIPAQTVLDAPVITMPPEEKDLLLAHTAALSGLGFVIEDFGGSSLVVRALPAVYEPAEAGEALSELARGLAVRGATQDEKREKILRMIACKSAVRSGDHSQPEELRRLVDRVLTDESVRFCPHGRPVLAVITKKELEKRFQRIV